MTEIPSAGMNGPAAAGRPDNQPAGGEIQCAELVKRVRNNDNGAMEELYRFFSRGIRFYFCRQLGPQDLDDKVHESFLIVAQAIRKGELREPERLMGYIHTVARRQVAAQIEEISRKRRHHVDMELGLTISDRTRSPEQEAIAREHEDLARRVLKGISHRDREILMRFYLEEQRPEQICSEMGLTETQFRLMKSRAKARFGELGKQRLSLRRPVRFK